jgi:hypothetical protein
MLRGTLALTCLGLRLTTHAVGQQATPADQPAYAHASCAPWDGMAVRIVLSEERDTVRVLQNSPRPGLELAAYTNLKRAVGREFRVGAEARSDDSSGGAWRCDSRGNCSPATRGIIRLERMTSDSTLVGSYGLAFPDGEFVRGRFAAHWLADRPLCG